MRFLLAALVTLLLPATASATPERSRDCFATTNWRGWSAPRGADFLYLRVGMNDVYRVGLTPGTRVRRSADEFLVNEVRGSGWICSALDLDLAISDNNGFSRPLIATDLRRLTPEEAEAIPREDRPH